VTPRRRLIVILAVLLGMPLLGAVVGTVWINRLADRRWAAAEERIRALSAAISEGDARRDPDHVTEASKENQIHFVAAIRLAAQRQSRRDEAFDLAGRGRRGEGLRSSWIACIREPGGSRPSPRTLRRAGTASGTPRRSSS